MFEIVMIDPTTHEEFILKPGDAEQQEFLLASLERNGIRARKVSCREFGEQMCGTDQCECEV